MFYSLLIALVLLFAGATLLEERLRAHPFIFLLYWGACAWITLLAVLLAIFDLLVIRASVRAERGRMEREHLERPHDPDAR